MLLAAIMVMLAQCDPGVPCVVVAYPKSIEDCAKMVAAKPDRGNWLCQISNDGSVNFKVPKVKPVPHFDKLPPAKGRA